MRPDVGHNVVVTIGPYVNYSGTVIQCDRATVPAMCTVKIPATGVILIFSEDDLIISAARGLSAWLPNPDGINMIKPLAQDMIDRMYKAVSEQIDAEIMRGVGLPEDQTCQHVFKTYQGLFETYNYCIHCDKKEES